MSAGEWDTTVGIEEGEVPHTTNKDVANTTSGLSLVDVAVSTLMVLTNRAKGEVVKFGVDFGVNFGVDTKPETIVLAAGVLIAAFVCCVCILCRCLAAKKKNKRRHENELAVNVANGAPEDDMDEHELDAAHSKIRAAAPGDSDLEEEALTTVQKTVATLD